MDDAETIQFGTAIALEDQAERDRKISENDALAAACDAARCTSHNPVIRDAVQRTRSLVAKKTYDHCKQCAALLTLLGYLDDVGEDTAGQTEEIKEELGIRYAECRRLERLASGITPSSLESNNRACSHNCDVFAAIQSCNPSDLQPSS